MDRSHEFVRCEIAERVAVVTIDRPPVNALSQQVLQELRGIFSGLADEPEVLAVVITGAGDKVFVAGADIDGLKELTPDTGKAANKMFQTTFNLIADFRHPVICALNGLAFGGGAELALACDIRIAADNCVFSWPEVNLGLIPAGGGTQRLGRQIPLAKAKELIFTGRRLTAAEAERIGLLNQVVPPGEALAAAKEMAGLIAAKGPVAVAQAKKAMNQGLELPLQEGVALELELSAACFGTDDVKEGISAFFDKRAPKFKGA